MDTDTDTATVAECLRRGWITRQQAAQMGHPNAESNVATRRDAWHEQADREVAAAYAQGRVDGVATYDASVAAALQLALGGRKAKTPTEAVRAHQRTLDQRAERIRADAGDPEHQRVAADHQQRSAERLRAHDQRMLAHLRTGPAWVDWRAVHRDVTPGVWASVWSALSDRTRAGLKDLAPSPAALDTEWQRYTDTYGRHR